MCKQTHVLAVLDKDTLLHYELVMNKTACAKQALRPDAVPTFVSEAVKTNFFREALFAYADALSLQDFFWQDLARRYEVAPQDMGKLRLDFQTHKLTIEDNCDTCC